jgi:hypothetical protein
MALAPSGSGLVAPARGLSLDWASFLVAMVLAGFVQLGILGNVPW